MNRKTLFFILLFLIIPFYPLRAEQIETDSVIIIFEEPLKIVAQRIVTTYGEVKSELEETFQLNLDAKPKLVLVKENKTFQKMTRNDFFVAFAIPQKNLMVIDYSKMNIHPFNLRITLKHELCHLLLHHHIRRTNLPKWLDEGICQWASDGISEIIMNKRSVLNQAILSDNLIPIKALTHRFPTENKNSLLLAYEESKSIVEYMVKKFGKARVLNILYDLKSGDKIDTAIEKQLFISFEELEKKWRDHIRKEKTWLVYISIHIYEILFFLGALITIYGFIKLTLKKRQYTDEDDADDDNYF